MEIVVYIQDSEGNEQKIFEGTVEPGSTVSTQDLTTLQTQFKKDGSPELNEDGTAKQKEVVSAMAVYITAPKPKAAK